MYVKLQNTNLRDQIPQSSRCGYDYLRVFVQKSLLFLRSHSSYHCYNLRKKKAIELVTITDYSLSPRDLSKWRTTNAEHAGCGDFSRWRRFGTHKLKTPYLDFYCLKQGTGKPTTRLGGTYFVDAKEAMELLYFSCSMIKVITMMV